MRGETGTRKAGRDASAGAPPGGGSEGSAAAADGTSMESLFGPDPDLPASAPAAGGDAVERLATFGEGPLSDAELLAILIGRGRSNAAVAAAAVGLASRFGSLRALARADLAEIAAAAAIDRRRAAAVKAALELGLRASVEKSARRPRFRSSRDIHAFVAPAIRDLPVEVFEVLLLDARHALLRRRRLSSGTLTGSLVHAREVFRPAILEGAASVVLVHNHPSGDPTPSGDDFAITERIAAAGRLIGIQVLDHVVVGGDGYVSFADTGRVLSATDD